MSNKTIRFRSYSQSESTMAELALAGTSFQDLLKNAAAHVRDENLFNRQIATKTSSTVQEAHWVVEALTRSAYPEITLEGIIDVRSVFTTLHAVVTGKKVSQNAYEYGMLYCLTHCKKLFSMADIPVLYKLEEGPVVTITIPVTVFNEEHKFENVDDSATIPVRDVPMSFTRNDGAFNLWYTKESNEHDAMCYFSLLVLTGLRAAGKGETNLLNAMNDKLPAMYKNFTDSHVPPSYPKITLEGAQAIRAAYRASSDNMNRILASMLLRHKYITDDSKFKSFFEWAIRTPLEKTGFHLYKIAVDVNNSGMNLASILNFLEKETNADDIIKQLENLNKYMFLFSPSAATKAAIGNVSLEPMSYWGAGFRQ